MPPRQSFDALLNSAVADITDHGFDSAGRVAYWTEKLRNAAEAALQPVAQVEEQLRSAFGSIYRRLIERGEIVKYHPGVSRFTLQKVAPQLRAELDRRILASASLIKMNREEAVRKTLQRFAGWSTSIPTGGGKVDKREVKGDIKKSLAQSTFAERRVLIDQGHKLTASISDIVAVGGGAIAGIWRSNYRQAGYDYREDHKERDGRVYLVKGCWAQEKGLVKPGKDGYTDDVTQPAEEPFCRCKFQWVYSLRGLPKEMLTKKGVEALKEAS